MELKTCVCGHKFIEVRGIGIHYERTLKQILTFSLDCKCGCTIAWEPPAREGE